MNAQTIQACLEQDGVTAGDTVIFALDTSGNFPAQSWASVSSDLRSALEWLGVERLILLTFDTRISDEGVFHRGEFHRIVDFPLRGGGGTDPRCLLTRFEGFAPIRIHVLTDGYFYVEPGERIGCDLRYLIWHNDYPQAVAHLRGARMIDLQLGT